jgi:hypothetical protein
MFNSIRPVMFIYIRKTRVYNREQITLTAHTFHSSRNTVTHSYPEICGDPFRELTDLRFIS